MRVSAAPLNTQVNTVGSDSKSVMRSFWDEMVGMMNNVSDLQSGKIESIDIFGMKIDDTTSVIFSTAVGLYFTEWNNITEFFTQQESFKTDLYKKIGQTLIS